MVVIKIAYSMDSENQIQIVDEENKLLLPLGENSSHS
jgi:hypothetical protein